MTFLSEYSLWLAIVCFVIGASYSFLLYYKNYYTAFNSKAKRFMIVFRGLAISLIAFLLIAPMLRLTVKETEKPIVIVGVDNTESIISNPDSTFYKTTFVANYQKFIKELREDYEVVTFSVGEQTQLVSINNLPTYIEKSTQLASLFDEVSQFYTNRNIGAIVLFSDGIFNEGANPQYLAEKQKAPVYTIGMGNPNVQPDLLIAGVSANKQTFMGNLFPVEIKVAATQLAGKTSSITVTKNEQPVFSKNIHISGNNFFETIRFTLTAKEKGVHQYKVLLTIVDGEISKKNNSANFLIEVIDHREKIAIVYNSPHPDIAAIKSALENSDKYQIELFNSEKLPTNFESFSLFIFHQLPSENQHLNNLVTKIQAAGTACLYILGESSNISLFNSLNTGLNIIQNKTLRNEALPIFNDNFVSFTFSDEQKKMLTKYPPLSSPFGDYKATISSNSFLYQKINGVNTNYPLFLFNETYSNRIGVITGSGLWQWKIYNYLHANNHEVFNEIFNKVALFLLAKGDKSFFRIATKSIYSENSPVEILGELYNDSYELQNEPDVEFTYTNSENKKYEALFSKQNNSYFLSLGKLPAGTYPWVAKVKYGDKSYSKTGVINVQELALETVNLVANHNLLQKISESTNGKFYLANEFSSLRSDLKSSNSIKTVASYQKKYSLLLQTWWYFALIILLLGIEWFLRKWHGGY